MSNEKTAQNLGTDTTGIHFQSFSITEYHQVLKEISVDLRKINNDLKCQLLDTAKYIDDMKINLLVQREPHEDLRTVVQRGYQPVVHFAAQVRELKEVLKTLKRIVESYKHKIEKTFARNPKAYSNANANLQVAEEIQNEIAIFDR